MYLGGEGSSTQILQVPYIVVIDCEVPPPNKIAYHSVQLGISKVINFAKQKDFAHFEWLPFIPNKFSNEKLPPAQIYTLKCNFRASKLSNHEKKDQHYIEFLLPCE